MVNPSTLPSDTILMPADCIMCFTCARTCGVLACGFTNTSASGAS